MKCWKGISKKGSKHLLQERLQILKFMKDHRQIYAIEKMCKVFKVRRTGLYVWFNGKPGKHELENREFLRHIKQVYE